MYIFKKNISFYLHVNIYDNVYSSTGTIFVLVVQEILIYSTRQLWYESSRRTRVGSKKGGAKEVFARKFSHTTDVVVSDKISEAQCICIQ